MPVVVTMSPETQRNYRRAAKKIRRAAQASGAATGVGLRVIGEEIMADVKASRPGAGVPKKTGNLASTGRVEGPKAVRGKPVVELSFGGAAAPYAVRQHEDTNLQHKVGEARYLVRGVERWRPGSSQAIQAIRENYQAALAAIAAGGGRR